MVVKTFLRLAVVGIVFVFNHAIAQSKVSVTDLIDLPPLPPPLALPLVDADSVPETGTFFFAFEEQPSQPGSPPHPFNPLAEFQFPVYSLGGNFFLVDNRTLSLATFSQMQSAASLLTQAAMNSSGLPEFAEGTGSPNEISSFSSLTFGTNDLWLEITGFTNRAAWLAIPRPSNDTSLFHDLFFTERLELPVQWQFIMRTVYSNAVVTDLCPPQGFFRLGPATNGNLTVTTNITAQQMAQLLVPSWVTVTNSQFTGSILARGTFAGGSGCGLPLNDGVILSSGQIAYAVGANTGSGTNSATFNSHFGLGGDTDLSGIVGNGVTRDAAILEFDIFSPTNFMLGFQYLYASEEYPEWVGDYNDPVAIFVSTNQLEANWINSITNDIALMPGTTNIPVNLNAMNGGCVSDPFGFYIAPGNWKFYVDNHDPFFHAVPPSSIPAPAFKFQYDGMTVLLFAQIQISANVTNHVKIAVADYGDFIYDTSVFIKAWTPCP